MRRMRQIQSFICLQGNKDGWRLATGYRKIKNMNYTTMSRNDFFWKLGRYILLLLMAFIAIALGGKVATAKDCSVCPGKGICKGETDCNKY